MARRIKNRFPFLVTVLVIAVLIIHMTTRGWQFSAKSPQPLTPEQTKSAQVMKEIVEELASRIGNRNYAEPAQLAKAQEYIAAQFSSIGYPVEFFAVHAKGKEFQNIIVRKPSRHPTQDVLVIGAHYDTCFNPGADDNASGVAGLIEVARALKSVELNFEVQFIAFVNEEPPFFMSEKMGSRQYTKWLKTQPVNVKGAIILEMIGYFTDEPFSQQYFPLVGPFYPNKGNFIALVSNFSSWQFLRQMDRGMREARQIPVASLPAPEAIPAVNFSDHWSFWQEEWPAILVTDTAFMRSPHYHQPSDLPATLNYEKMAQVVSALKEAVIGLSKQK